MATNDMAQGATAGARSRTPLLGRERLARMVVVGSFLTLFLLVSALIALAQGNNSKDAAGAAEKAFNAILPVLAGWVGTVLAFYFSSANQEHTNDILDKTIGRVGGGGPSDGVLVSEKMIPSARIQALRDLAQNGKGPAQIPLSDLRNDFDAKLPNGAAVTRLLFVENGIFKFVLHAALLNGFIVKASPPADATFEALLQDQDVVHQISKLVVFVAATATLAEAKTALERVAGAQDIIVTPTGNATEPMLGWLTNVDLSKALTVS
jgi:hypothetical protein